jgi:Bacterial SH3 domain.
VTWWSSFKNLFSADFLAVLSLVLFAIVLFLLFVFLTARRSQLRKFSFFAGVFALLLFVLSMVFSIQKKHELIYQNQAILMTPTITVKSSPSASSVDLFVLHEGSKMEVLDKVNDWTKVKIANGSVGWLPSDVLSEF